MDKEQTSEVDRPVQKSLQKPGQDWQVLGETFEAMGKAGLALTVGFLGASAFCKMVDSGKVKLPNVFNLILPESDPDQLQREQA